MSRVMNHLLSPLLHSAGYCIEWDIDRWMVPVIYYVTFFHLMVTNVAQSVTCLETDASLTADPGVASSIRTRSHSFVEIDHEIISTVILLHSIESFKKGCCQLQVKVCAGSTG